MNCSKASMLAGWSLSRAVGSAVWFGSSRVPAFSERIFMLRRTPRSERVRDKRPFLSLNQHNVRKLRRLRSPKGVRLLDHLASLPSSSSPTPRLAQYFEMRARRKLPLGRTTVEGTRNSALAEEVVTAPPAEF